MAYLLFRRESSDGHSGLGLGWLLAIALGGAVLLFLAVGLLLAWRLKARAQPCTTRVYSMDGLPSRRQESNTRLTKRRLLASDYSTSRFSSRLSLTLPPILPPLPSYNSSILVGNRRRSSSWVDEDTLHGPKMSKSGRESWFSMDTWLGRTPTLPNLHDVEAAEKGEAKDERPENPALDGRREPRQMPRPEPQQEINVLKRQSRPALQTSQTAPELSAQEEPPRGRSRAPAQSHVKPSMTEIDLRDILHSTEQRLRDGTSRSPTKTPRGSPTKGSPTKSSPMKTPKSYRTASSHGTSRAVRGTPSPSKRAGQHTTTTTPRTNSRNGSVSSIGSAANSLIREATEQLELPGGSASPSRLRGMEWEPQPQDQPVQQVVQPRRMSMDSDVSSSLSTLYSMEEPEESVAGGQRNDDDPFVEERREVTIPLPARNPLRKRTQTVSGASQLMKTPEPSGIPAPLRPLSVNSHIGSRRNSVKADAWKLPIVLHPPSRPVSEDVGPKNLNATKQNMSRTPSAESMVTDTVHSDSEPELPSRRSSTTERGGARGNSRSQTPSPSTPRGRDVSTDMSSSPYDEQDILSLLLSSSQPKRALPMPPKHVDGNGEVTTSLSPRPKGHRIITHVRKPSSASTSSSNYSDPAAIVTGSPPRRTTSSKENTVGSTISQLRRMNSMVSSYSVASLASTVVGTDADSPSLPPARLSPSRSTSKVGSKAISSRHYLNVGTAKQRRGTQPRPDAQDHGKENVGLGLRVPRGGESAGLREARKSGNLGREASSVGKAKLGPVEELMAEERRREDRDSVESLGLYDKDGFLIGSPDREAKGRYMRM